MSVIASLLFLVLCCGITCKWVHFLSIDVFFLLACIVYWNIYNRLVITCIVKTAVGVKCLCSASEKELLSSGFSFLIVFDSLRAPQIIVKFSVFITVGVEDALAAILFQVGVNNFLIFFAVINIREKLCRVAVPVESKIP